MLLMSELVGQVGVYPLLCEFLDRNELFKQSEIENLIDEKSIPNNVFSDLVKTGLVTGSTYGFYLSPVGRKTSLLLQAINGEEDLDKVVKQLAILYPELKPYTLITNDITNFFLDSINTYADFIRLSICSPWINLDEKNIEKIRGAILRASSQYTQLQIRVITVPLEQYHNKNAAKRSLGALKELGAVIVTNEKLHAKLYMSEPGPKGGSYFAILGSENLTGKGNIELGIKIENDNEILRKLDQYFFDIWQYSTLLQEV